MAGKRILLDGGMGHQLKAMGVTITGECGSMRRFLGVAMANTENPELVRDAHLAFIDAGAEVITTNNYAVVPRVVEMTDTGNPARTLEEMLLASCKVARDACDMRPERNVRIAGALPPLNASYRSDLVGEYDTNLALYQTIANIIAPHCDILLCETMSTVLEAKAAATAAAATGLPVWVAWTLDENKPVLRSLETINEAVEALANVKVEGFMFNCTSPEITTAAMPLLRDAPGLPQGALLGAYANGFLTSSSGSGEYRDLSEAEYYDNHVTSWMEGGATIVGGCCGIFPNHIAYMRKQFDKLEDVTTSGEVDVTLELVSNDDSDLQPVQANL